MTRVMKSIAITGSSSGIGRATALLLGQNAWRVFAAVRKDSDANDLAKASNDRVEPILLDVTDRQSIASAAQDVAQRLQGQGLDALFNNAGVGTTAPVEFFSLEKLRELFEINLFGQVATIQAFLPLLRKAKGRIINSGSVGDHITPPFGGGLAGSKAAFASMTAALRLELRPQGISVCLLEPGAIDTPAVEKTLGDVDKIVHGLPPEGIALYGDAMLNMARTFAQKEHAGSPPEVVARVVERALTDRHPRTRYPAGKDARKLELLATFLPEKLLDVVLLRTFGLRTYSRSGTKPSPTA
jgi:NAD(P)-dependent dehydrogenase (short-subunit alcohol dehydrogenase family)